VNESHSPMRAPAEPSGSSRPSTRLSRGFSFVEVLFAVMILGIGFIMVAAIFPVAIQQTQNASDESVSAAVAWNAITVIQEKLSDPELPPVTARTDAPWPMYPGLVRSFRDPQARGVPTLAQGQYAGRMKDTRSQAGPQPGPASQITFAQPKDYLWNRIRGESVVVDDRRFAWVAFYRRHYVTSTQGDPAPYVQVLVVVARARETSAFSPGDLTDARLANLQPRPVQFDLTSDGTGPKVDQVVTFTGGDTDAVAEGAYLIVAHDRLPSVETIGARAPQGAMNCHVFRIGNHVAGDTWELSPEADFLPETIAGKTIPGLKDAQGYVIGRTRTAGRYEGMAQDVAVYTMIVPVH